MPVLDEGGDALGTLSAPLIHPDTGSIEGFFVRLPGMFAGADPFVSTHDILHWGTYVRVNDGDALGPIEDRLRLASLAQEGRTILGQRIMTESGRSCGTCADVQFDTRHFQLEWIFPRRWWRWGIALPASDIVEVRPSAVVVREPVLPAARGEKQGLLRALDELADGAPIVTPSPVRSLRAHEPRGN